MEENIKRERERETGNIVNVNLELLKISQTCFSWEAGTPTWTSPSVSGTTPTAGMYPGVVMASDGKFWVFFWGSASFKEMKSDLWNLLSKTYVGIHLGLFA